MGFNTIVFILNDQFGQIERNPEAFVQGIAENMPDGNSSYPDGNGSYVVGQTTVFRSEHADVPQCVFTQHNTAWDMHPTNVKLQESATDDLHVRAVVRARARTMIEWAEQWIAFCDQLDEESV